MRHQHKLLKLGRYYGGKNAAGTYHRIIDLMPAHWHYAEPYAGSAALFRRKPIARQSYLIDADPEVAKYWRKASPSGTIVECGDATRWLKRMADQFTRDWLLYLDPPYPLGTRSKKKAYAHEMTDQQHVEMLDVVVTLDCNIILSSYYSKLYAERLKDWWHDSFWAMTRGGKPREEHLYCNFTPGDSVSLSRPYAGGNYRERERVKRKIGRHVTHFLAMPAWERQALLSALLAAANAESDDSRGQRRN